MPPSPEVHRPRARWAGLAGLVILTVLAVLSYAQGIRNALERSQDFQWSGVRMLLAGVNPWTEYLRGDPRHLIHLSQIPNYLPVLYVLIAPLGLLPLVPAEILWAVCNGIFAVVSAWLAARFYGLRAAAVWAVICLTMMATPVRQTIGNGQQGLLVLVLWTLSLLAVCLTDGRAAVAGMSYFKFNFAPATLMYLLLRGGLRAAFVSILPAAAATVAVWLWLAHEGNIHELISVITGPFAVSRTGYFPSGAEPNLMDILQVALFHSYARGSFLPARMIPDWVNATTFAGALVVCMVLLYIAVRRTPGSSVQWQMAVVGTASYVLFKHHSYDSVVLLLPLCYAMRLWRQTRAKVALGAVAYAWYLERAFDPVHMIWKYLFFVEFAVLILLLTMIFQLQRFEAEARPAWPSAG